MSAGFVPRNVMTPGGLTPAERERRRESRLRVADRVMDGIQAVGFAVLAPLLAPLVVYVAVMNLVGAFLP